MGKRFASIAVVTAVIALILSANRPPASTPSTAALQTHAHYGQLPLSFEPNRGQVDSRVKFVSRGNGATIFLTPNEAVLALSKATFPVAKNPSQGTGPARNLLFDGGAPAKVAGLVLRIRFEGADPKAPVEGVDLLKATSNYLIGNDPGKWKTQIPNYGKVRYRNLYKGIDLIYYGNQRQLEYDLIAYPGSNVDAIRFGLDGAERTEISSAGDLVLKAGGRQVILRKPLVYQDIDAVRTTVPVSYRCLDDSKFGFTVGAYDHRKPLVIDPTLSYATYLGGTFAELTGIALDAQRNAYVGGWAFVFSDFPTTAGAYQGALNGANDAVITKLDPTGSSLVYSTYLGGSGLDAAFAIAVDPTGYAYVAGGTASADFPTTPGAYQTSFKGSNSAFVAKLNQAGTALVYSTYLGGSVFDYSLAIAVDHEGSAYTTGVAFSPDFPITPGGFQTSVLGSPSAFVTKINPGGTGLTYSSFVSAKNSFSTGSGIAIDGSSNVYMAGGAGPGLPTTRGSFPGLGNSGFVARINTSASGPSSLKYLTYLGGSSDDGASAIALRQGCTHDCNAYVTGTVLSTDFPATTGQLTSGGMWDSFVTQLDANGGLVYSRYLGGSFYDAGAGIAVDRDGHAYVVGTTHSFNFPTEDSVQTPGAPGGQLFSGAGPTPSFSLVSGWPGSVAGTVRSMALDGSTKPATYYVGTDHNGVWKSVDGGASFTQTGLTGPRAGNVQVFSLDFNESTHVLYAGGKRLFASLDGGAHFLPLLGIPSDLEVTFVASDHDKPLPHVFAGTTGGWFTSSNGGFSFKPAIGLPSHTVAFGGAVDEADGLVFAATSKGIFLSNDSGASFEATNLTFTACADHMASDTVSTPHVIYASCDAGVFAGPIVNGVVNFTAGNIGGLFGLLADNAVSSPGPAPVFAGVQSNFWSQVYESTAGVTNFALNPNIGLPPAFGFLPGALGALPDESIPILVDPTTRPETIFVHDSWEHDATITVLSEDGSHFVYSSRLGGSNNESATGIAIDGDGDAYVAGLTMSTDFPITPGAAQAAFGCAGCIGIASPFVNGFVARLTSADQD